MSTNPADFKVERGFLACRRVVVLKRDIATELGIEQCSIGIQLAAGLLWQIGEGIALKNGRNAVYLAVIADEVETFRPWLEVRCDVLVVLPVLEPACIKWQDQLVLDQWLLHAADDVDDVVGLRPPPAINWFNTADGPLPIETRLTLFPVAFS